MTHEKSLNFLSGELASAVRNRTLVVNKNFNGELSESQIYSLLTNDATKGLRGAFISRLILTGQYPTYREALRLFQRIQIDGAHKALNELISEIEINEAARESSSKIEFFWPVNKNLVDVSHTLRHPFVTGIQRVVREILKLDVNGSFSLIEIDPTHRIISMVDPQHFHNSMSRDKNESDNGFGEKIVNFLHQKISWFEANSRRRVVLRIVRPTARKIKRVILERGRKDMFNYSLKNMLILNSKLSLLDIPNNDGTIELHRSFTECEIVRLQSIFYDLIPFFEPDMVSEGLVGHYGKYFGLVLRAEKVVAISELVAEQFSKVSEAFHLQNPRKNVRPRITSLALPSGLPALNADTVIVPNRIVVLGSIEPRKNHIQIFGALEMLYKEGKEFETILIGNAGWDNEEILKNLDSIRALGINCYRRNKTTDYELNVLLSSAQMSIFVSEAEGFGLPVVESLAVGTPVIVSNIRPLVDIQSKHVYSVDLHNVQELKEKIEEVATIGKFAPQVFPTSWDDWYGELLNF
jgi:glycosyltransferase involved in cell wall biosynthesis